MAANELPAREQLEESGRAIAECIAQMYLHLQATRKIPAEHVLALTCTWIETTFAPQSPGGQDE